MEYWNPQQPPGCAATRRATCGLPSSWSSSFTFAAAVSVSCIVAPRVRVDYMGTFAPVCALTALVRNPARSAAWGSVSPMGHAEVVVGCRGDPVGSMAQVDLVQVSVEDPLLGVRPRTR